MSLPAELFHGMASLGTLSLEGNHLTDLPTALFRGLINLIRLYLTANRLKYINRNIFGDLPSLQYLALDDNILVHVSDFAFGIAPYNFINLRTVLLGYNHLEDFPTWVLDMPFLSEIDLSGNHLNFSGITKSMRRSKNPMYDQMNNSFIQNETIFTYKGASNRNMNLTNNLIRKIELFDLDNATWIRVERLLLSFQLYMYGNELECNCDIYSLFKFFKKKQGHTDALTYNKRHIRCDRPNSLKGHVLAEVSEDMLGCYSNMSSCPPSCKCWVRSMDSAVMVYCAYRELTLIPELMPPHTLQINLTGNQIRELSFPLPQYISYLETVDLSANLLMEIDSAIITQLCSDCTVYLHDNDLTHLPKEVRHSQILAVAIAVLKHNRCLSNIDESCSVGFSLCNAQNNKCPESIFPPSHVCWAWNKLAKAAQKLKTILVPDADPEQTQIWSIVPCIMSDISWKFNESTFNVMFLTDQFRISVCFTIRFKVHSYKFQFARLSVCLWTESCPFCIFQNTSLVHFIFIHLFNRLQKVCRLLNWFLPNFLYFYTVYILYWHSLVSSYIRISHFIQEFYWS